MKANLLSIITTFLLLSNFVYSQKSYVEISFKNDSVVLKHKEDFVKHEEIITENYSIESGDTIYKRPIDVTKMPIYKDCEVFYSKQARSACMHNNIFKNVFKNITYPMTSVVKEVEGSVVLNYVVEKDGSVVPTSLLFHDKNLKEATLGAVVEWLKEIRQLRFTPAFVGDKPVKYADFVVFTYRLDSKKDTNKNNITTFKTQRDYQPSDKKNSIVKLVRINKVPVK